MSVSEVTNSFSLILSWLITLSLKCHFSRLRKYFIFFSPSLYHLALHLNIAPWVRHLIISSNSFLHESSSSVKVLLCRVLTEGWITVVLFQVRQFYVLKCVLHGVFCVLCRFFAKLIEFSRTFISIMSQRRARLIESLFWYSCCVCAMVNFIMST